MPVMQFLKMLDKLDREGVFKNDTTLIERKITVDNLKKAKVFPFRLYTAYMNIKNTKAKNILAEVLDEYSEQYDWSVFKDAGSWVLAPDISASMTYSYRTSIQNKKRGGLMASVIAGMFTGFLYKGIKNSMVIPWDTEAKEYNRPRRDSVITHIDTIADACGGGTYMETVLHYMKQKSIKADNVLMITDSMEWGDGWLNAWVDYKKSNPKAKAFLLRVDAYPTKPFSDEHAEKYDIHQIYGWSDNVIKYIEYCLEK
jgi:hypothetical protein